MPSSMDKELSRPIRPPSTLDRRSSTPAVVRLSPSPQHASACCGHRSSLAQTTRNSNMVSPHPHRRRASSTTLPSILIFWLSVVLFSSASLLGVGASALTTNVSPGERLCFHAWVDKVAEKVGFYFAVQSGGSFDIDWTITDPTDTIVMEGEKERQGDYIFTAAHVGEYSFCFNNDMSSFSEKFVDFDIMVENEPRPVAPAKPTSIAEQTSSLEDSIYKLSGSLSNIQRTQKYFRTRENRNSATVRDTQSRILYVNLGTSLLLIGMSFTQVFIVRKFFNSPGKYVRV